MMIFAKHMQLLWSGWLAYNYFASFFSFNDQKRLQNQLNAFIGNKIAS